MEKKELGLELTSHADESSMVQELQLIGKKEWEDTNLKFDEGYLLIEKGVRRKAGSEEQNEKAAGRASKWESEHSQSLLKDVGFWETMEKERWTGELH